MPTPGRHNFDLRVNADGYVLAPGIDLTTDFTSGRGLPNHREEHSIQRFPLGTSLWDPSLGRVWKYTANTSVALAAGLLTQSSVPTSGHENMPTLAAVAGATVIDVVPATAPIVVDEYNEGMFYINDALGEGEMMRVKDVPGITHTENGDIVLYDPVVTAFDADTTGTILRHPFSKTIVQPGGPTAPLNGVPGIPITASYYYWSQIMGPAAVAIDAGVAAPIMSLMRASDEHAGFAEIFINDAATTIEQIVGVTQVVAVDDEYVSIALQGLGYL